MQSAESTYLAAAAVPATVVRPLRPSANTLVAVADAGIMLRRVQQALYEAGITQDAIELVWGRAGQFRLARPTRHGLFSWIGRRVEALGPELSLAERYQRELAAGHALVVAHGVPRGLAELVHGALVAAGGRCLRHYGRFSVAFLTA
jgi:hypothetical protein